MEDINAMQAASPYYIDLDRISELSRNARITRRDIESLFKVDACAAWETLGAWKALIGDWEGVQEAFRNSLALGSTGSNRVNWVINCINLGMFSAGQEAYAAVGAPESNYFSVAQIAGVRCGAVELVAHFVERAKKMQINWDEGSEATLNEAHQMLKGAGISDEQIGRHLDIAGVVLRRHHIRPKVYPRVISAEGFFNGVTYTFTVPVSAAEAFEMNMELAEGEVEAGIVKDVAFDVVFEAEAA